MPLYKYKCELCEEISKFLTDEPSEDINCNKCGGWIDGPAKAYRFLAPSTYQNLEMLDNGLSAKPIERYADAERLFRERADKNTLENQENG